jgi:hypothetical protein
MVELSQRVDQHLYLLLAARKRVVKLYTTQAIQYQGKEKNIILGPMSL